MHTSDVAMMEVAAGGVIRGHTILDECFNLIVEYYLSSFPDCVLIFKIYRKISKISIKGSFIGLILNRLSFLRSILQFNNTELQFLRLFFGYF